jgi:bla regulator protein BlaR1
MQALLKTITWTLVHSLWQGLVVAILAALVMTATKKTKAGVRYNLLTLLFIVFTVSVSVTFILQWQQLAVAAVTEATTANDYYIAAAENAVTEPAQADWYQQFSEGINSNASVIMLVWACFFLLSCLRIGKGLIDLKRLRHEQVFATDESWKEKLAVWQLALGIQRPVQLFESALVNVPVTLGTLKPVILLPLGLLAQLPADQVEAVLVHELGHIRRKDFLVNLLQKFAEAIFFFNPGLRWLSSLLRQERETCCDDMVIERTGKSRTYIEALLFFQDHSTPRPAYGMALAGKQGYLLNRVKRMITKENTGVDTLEKVFLLFCFFSLSAFTVLTNNRQVDAYAATIKTPFYDNITGTIGDERNELSRRVQPAKDNTALLPADTVPPKQKPVKKKAKENAVTIPETKEPVQQPAAVRKEPTSLEQIIQLKEKIGEFKEEIKEKTDELKDADPQKVESIKSEIAAKRKELEKSREELAKVRIVHNRRTTLFSKPETGRKPIFRRKPSSLLKKTVSEEKVNLANKPVAYKVVNFDLKHEVIKTESKLFKTVPVKLGKKIVVAKLVNYPMQELQYKMNMKDTLNIKIKSKPDKPAKVKE